MRQLRFFLIVIVLPLLTVLAVSLASPRAAAATLSNGTYREGFFTGTGGYGNVYPVESVVSGGIPGWVTDKEGFKEWVDNLLHGDARQGTAGDFIVRLMLSGKDDHSRPDDEDIAEWKRRLDNPNIGMKIERLYPFDENSGYNSTLNDEMIYYLPDSADSIVFYDISSGVEYFAIKIACGNAVGDPIGLPEADEAPTVSANDPNCDDLEFHGTASDPDYDGHVKVDIFRNGTRITTLTTNGRRRTFSYDIPASSAAVRATYEARVTSVDSDGNQVSGGAVDSDSAEVGGCNDGYCGPALYLDIAAGNTTQTLNPEARVDFWVVPQFVRSTNPRFSVSITSPAGVVTTRNNVAYSVSGTGNVRANATLRASIDHIFMTAGVYQIRWSLSGSSDDTRLVNVTCDGAAGGDGGGGSITAGDKPYFEVRGGDIIAGVSFPNDGGVPSSASSRIAAWDSGAAPYDGSKGNLAVIAKGTITQFASGADPTNPSRLTFANSPASSSPVYGGGYDALPATPDYIENALAGGNLQPCPAQPIRFDGVSSGIYHCSGNVTIGTSVLTSGKNITIIADGSVFIAGDITYSYSGLADIPRLNVYTRGDIVVAGVVSQLHGIFVAQGKDRKFYTCGSAAAGYEYANLSGHAECATKLTVYGSVVAGELILGRITGSWTRPAEGPAETFVHSPEAWLGKPLDAGSTTSQIEFDSYISLPPLL